MNTIRYTDASFAKRLRELAAASSLFDPVIEQRTRAILEDVRARGDAALLELTERFDGAKLSAEQLPVTQAELVTASLKADESAARGGSRGGAEYRGVCPEVPAQGLADPQLAWRGGRGEV